MTDISRIQGSEPFHPVEGTKSKVPEDPTKGVLPPVNLVIGQIEKSFLLAESLGFRK